jgi:Skp family chaperone for outer membrane proteins
MNVFVTSIAELSQHFFQANPLTFNDYFAITPSYQKRCSHAHLFTRISILFTKEVMLIHDIAIHLLAGGYKLTMGTIKGICVIASGILNLEIDHQTPSKQAVVHLGFACVYVADLFVSVTTINNTYPQSLMDKIKDIFTKFLKSPNKGTIVEYRIDPEIEKALRKKQAETEEKERALQEEQRKTKEQEELLKKAQQELKDIRDSDFISEEEFEKIFKEAQEVVDTKIYEENSIEEELIYEEDSLVLPKNTLLIHPSQYMLTYHTESDEDYWYDGSFHFSNQHPSLTLSQEQALKKDEAKENIHHSFTIADRLESPKTEIKSTSHISKAHSRKPFSGDNPYQISALYRRTQYSKELKKRRKKNQATH